MTTTQSGLLLIADITGYTMFLSASELEHAQEILSTLLNGLIDHTRPPFVISRTAGDAVISYAAGQTSLLGQTFVEILEDTYITFRRAIELMVLNNTCKCAACRNVSALDLKFFVHYGQFALQTLGDHVELVGNDVNLIHRLMKNSIVEDTGIRAYVVYTAAAVDALGLAEMASSMTPHQESYDHLGVVDLFVEDLHPVWEARRAETDVDIAPGEVLVTVDREFPLPPHLMWDFMSRPAFRASLFGAISQTTTNRHGGRIAPGTEIHCDHGDSVTVQRILTWRPFEMMLIENQTPVPGATCYFRYTLIPSTTGTCLEIAVSRGRGPAVKRFLLNVMGKWMLPGVLIRGLEQLAVELEA
jgi:hypothetical protein